MAHRQSGEIMKVLFAADGSKFTTKALKFLTASKRLLGKEDELVVLNVQDAISPQVEKKLGREEVEAFQLKQADKVLKPIKQFLDRHPVRYRCVWVVGSAASEIVKASKRERVRMIVMGAHGHGLLFRALMGSVAQRVMADCEIPVLMVK
jgi:nucleotide-binding universal stress UspA family protein